MDAGNSGSQQTEKTNKKGLYCPALVRHQMASRSDHGWRCRQAVAAAPGLRQLQQDMNRKRCAHRQPPTPALAIHRHCYYRQHSPVIARRSRSPWRYHGPANPADETSTVRWTRTRQDQKLPDHTDTPCCINPAALSHVVRREQPPCGAARTADFSATLADLRSLADPFRHRAFSRWRFHAGSFTSRPTYMAPRRTKQSRVERKSQTLVLSLGIICDFAQFLKQSWINVRYA